jgi:hypothetical protein
MYGHKCKLNQEATSSNQLFNSPVLLQLGLKL